MTDTELIRENLRHENGVLWWTKPGKSRVLSDPAGALCRGYIRVQLRGKNYPAHRIVWLLEFGHWPESRIDHIDGDKRNNIPGNLRLANASLNGANRKRNATSSSAYKGVHFDKKSGTWRARITVMGKTKNIGSYQTEQMAADAYDARAIAEFGAFAKTNKEAVREHT